MAVDPQTLTYVIQIVQYGTQHHRRLWPAPQPLLGRLAMLLHTRIITSSISFREAHRRDHIPSITVVLQGKSTPLSEN